MTLSLKSKGWIFVVTSIVCEVFFVATMYALVESSERATHNYQHKLDLDNQTITVFVDLYRTSMALVRYFIGHPEDGDKTFEMSYQRSSDGLLKLKRLAVSPDEQYAVLEVNKLGNTFLRQLKANREAITDEGPLKFMSVRKILPLLAEINKHIGTFTEMKEVDSQREEIRRQTYLRNVLIALFAGLGANIVIAIWFANWFLRKFSSDLGRLMENTMRFASGVQLLPPLKSADEIAQVDHTFHVMAEALEEAARKEKEATEILRASEERTKGIIENMPLGLILIEHGGAIVSVNPQTETIFQCSSAQLVGRNISELFAQKGSTDSPSFMSMITQRALGHAVELEAVRKSGHRFPAEIALNEFSGADGKQLLVNVQDVTERHAVERMKREFVAMVSHDLRTPLTSVHGSLTLLSAGAMGDLSPEAQEVVTTAETEVERLTRLVSDLLDASKIEAGKMEVLMEEIKIQPVLRRAVSSITKFAEQHNVRIESDSADAVVMGDSERLIQVVINLLSNAVKFSPPGEAVTIQCKPQGAELEVAVRDRGRGVPAAHREAIFERFHQVEGADASTKKGTGLGLPICKTIIEQHGGTIGVDSEPGKGSTFWFRIPLASADVGSGARS